MGLGDQPCRDRRGIPRDGMTERWCITMVTPDRINGVRLVTDRHARIPDRIPAAEVDVRIRDEGSVVLLWPISEAAVDWFDTHLPEDRISWGGATVCEARYVWDILYALREDGLVIGSAR